MSGPSRPAADGVLVVGACQAGLQVAVSLREFGHTGPVTLVGAEPHLPYQRPPLSKAYLAGTATATSLALRNEEFFAAQDITLVRGERVLDVDLDAGTAQTDIGRSLSFAAVALTTGARARRLPVDGADLDGVLVLRDLAHADALAEALPAATRVVVVGGGFIGLEAAAVARDKGKDVTVVEAGERLMARAVAPVVSEFYRSAHERRGTSVLLSTGVTALEGEAGRVTGVVLADGTVLPADLVLVGIGVTARTELAKRMGLAVQQGAVLVDELARTSDPRVVAAGDCTLLPSPQAPEVLVRLESVQNAIDQAKTAAATLLGGTEPYRAVPWFWSDQSGIKLQIAGLSYGYDDVVVRGNVDAEAFSALYLREGRLLAVDSVNRAPEYMAVRRALGRGPVLLDRTRAADSSVPLKELLAG
ncbi:MAG: EthA protein [Frankiales bacterium]|nr:EthA protein [Frankiales bacterium]